MSKITNLTQFRKQQGRVKKRAQGDVNAAKFGRSKAQKSLEAAREDKAQRGLDGHQRESSDE